MSSATLENQYRIATTSAGLFAGPDRGLIEVSGADRAAWLHNLCTNEVKSLVPGRGNYAFACNVKGRTLFDLDVLVLDDRLWLDLDAGWIDAALNHLNRYLITENVTLSNRTADFTRLSVMGPAAAEVVARMGFGDLASMTRLQHSALTWQGRDGLLVRNDFVGLPVAMMIVPRAAAADLTPALLDAGRPSGLARIDPPTVETLRIEAGLPASRRDIDEEVIPPETGQIERGISYTKGCYLGQEVIERMRSHNALARRLVGIRLDGDAPPPVSARLNSGQTDVGRLTSAAWSCALGAVLGLGYVRTALARQGESLSISTPAGSIRGEIVSLPVRPLG